MQPFRRIPYHFRDKFEQKLQELESYDIIEKVDEPSNGVVVVPKVNGDMRLCVDMQRANEAFIRERYVIPTIDDILTGLNQSQVFSKLDIKWTFHHIKLDPSARKINYVSNTHRTMFSSNLLIIQCGIFIPLLFFKYK